MAVENDVFLFWISPHQKQKNPNITSGFFYFGDYLKTYSLSALIFNIFVPLSSSTSLLR